MARFDVVIVGGGIIGVAAAREILTRQPGTSLAVVDKEPTIGEHQTGHNSGVIHSGIYYAPGSLKARLCTAGARLMYEFCESHGVKADSCGKLIVATAEDELPALDELHRRGTANGVPGLEMIGPAGIAEREPHCTGIRAIWSPVTGIVDFSQVALAIAGDVAQLGGVILTGHPVTGLTVRTGSIAVVTSRGELTATRVLTCAGLSSDRVARLSGAPAEPRIVPFRGDYWQLRPERRHLAQNLIYPVPDPKFPFLGVHFTRRIADGAVWLGPNAVLAFAREGYRRWDVRPGDLARTLGYPGSGAWRASTGAPGWPRCTATFPSGPLSRPASVSSLSLRPPTSSPGRRGCGPNRSPTMASWWTTSASTSRAGSSCTSATRPRPPRRLAWRSPR